MEKTNFEISFTQGELFWLGSVFGKAQFPLINPAYTAPDAQKLGEEMKTGRDSLIRRRLVFDSGQGTFQVERLVYFLVDWLSQPENVTVIEMDGREGTGFLTAVHEKQGHYLTVKVNKGSFDLCLFPDASAISQEIAGHFEKPAKEGKDKQVRMFPLLQPLYLVRLAWKSEEKAEEAMRVRGYEKKYTRQTVDWLAQLAKAGSITRYAYSTNGEKPVAQSLFALDQDGYWLSQTNPQEGADFEIRNVPAAEIVQRIIEKG